MEIAGTVALVTGAASGIGRACALTFARAGADLVVADLDLERLEEVAAQILRVGRRCLSVRCDVSDAEEVAALAERATKELGPVRLLMSNAGIGGNGRAHEVPLDEWRKVIGTNLFGAVHLISAFVPRMIASGRGGHLVLTASLSGLGVSLPFMAPYAVAKAGLVALGESLHMELEEHRIGVSIVCPGMVATRMSEVQDNAWALKPEVLRTKGISPDRVAEAVLEAIRSEDLYVVVGAEQRLLWMLKRAAPAAFTRLAGRRGRSEKALRDLQGFGKKTT
jgi:NAD(P)-dependent dehydrogenase (short-subunit alcohol dehydrogenase family)